MTSASGPGIGPTASGPGLPSIFGPATKGPKATTANGLWRPNAPFIPGRDGLRIRLSAERGVTPKGYLRVPFRFQAPPIDSFGRPWEFGYETYTTIKLGERPRAGGKQLHRISLQTMFLDEALRFMIWRGTLDVQRLLLELRSILERPAPFRLVIGQPALWGPRPLVNTVAVFTRIEPEQRGGEVGTEYTSVEFMEWPGEQLERKRRPGAHHDQERRHTLRKGDTLHKLAKHYFHRASAWKLIARANGITHVSPDSAAELAKWAKQHHRKTLKIPPAGSRLVGGGIATGTTTQGGGSVTVEQL